MALDFTMWNASVTCLILFFTKRCKSGLVADDSYMDKDGFAPFGQVVRGMDVVDKVFAYARVKEPDRRRILREGNEYLKEFPQLDCVEMATIVPAK